MEASVAFYRDILGMEKLFVLDDKNGNLWIVYMKAAKGQFIELFYTPEGFDPANERNGRFYDHICLAVDDIYAAAEEIKGKGWKLDVEPNMGMDFNIQSWLRDPDGNAIELMQIMPESEQGKSMS